MILDKKIRFLFVVLGLAVLFFLSAAQVGLLIGWCNTNSAIIRHANADIWIMAEQTPAFDYGTAIPRQRIGQARSIEGVEWAEGMFMAWNVWRRKDGRRVNVELIGLDRCSIGGPWNMKEGKVENVHLPDGVIVDELYLGLLGIDRVGDEAEMFDKRAIVRGVSQEVRTFTASPFIFTSLRSAIKYDRRYHPDEITYVLVRCAEGYDPYEIAESMKKAIPHVEVLTKEEFSVRTVKYWMLETGIGITVVLTAFLGVLVSVVVTSQTLFAITQENMGNYATLLALGFSRSQMVGSVVFQSVLLGGCGVMIGSGMFMAAALLSASTPIPLETSVLTFTGLIVLSLVCSMTSSVLSLRAILGIDPVAVFRM